MKMATRKSNGRGMGKVSFAAAGRLCNYLLKKKSKKKVKKSKKV